MQIEFYNVLKNIRKELGLTQEQLAHELNVSFSTINRWENSRTSPSRLAKLHLVEYCKSRGIHSEFTDQLKDS